jgi:predicted transcriptional regulator
MTVHVTIPLEDEAKAELDAWAQARGVPVADLLTDAVGTYLAEHRSIAAARSRGQAALAAGDVHDHADVVAEFAERRAVWQLQA